MSAEGTIRQVNPNPNASKRVVTDVKSQAQRAHGLIAERYLDVRHQFIAQAFFPEEFSAYRQLEFRGVIWTLYRFGSDGDRVLRELEIHEPGALAMPMEMVNSGLLKTIIADIKRPVFVHTINDPLLAVCLIGSGVGDLYSDDLSISDLSNIPVPEPNCLQDFVNRRCKSNFRLCFWASSIA